MGGASGTVMLTQRSKYALRAMLLLAAQPKDKLMLVGDIAEKRKIPRKFLEQILLEIGRAHV